MRRALALGLALALASTAYSQTPAGSPVEDLIRRARTAVNDLNYKRADSLARRALEFGDIATKEERIAAMQVMVAAWYTEEASQQRIDTAITYIRQLIKLGATKGMPRDLTSPSLDTLYALTVSRSAPTPAPASQPTVVSAGTPTDPGPKPAVPTAPSPRVWRFVAAGGLSKSGPTFGTGRGFELGVERRFGNVFSMRLMGGASTFAAQTNFSSYDDGFGTSYNEEFSDQYNNKHVTLDAQFTFSRLYFLLGAGVYATHEVDHRSTSGTDGSFNQHDNVYDQNDSGGRVGLGLFVTSSRSIAIETGATVAYDIYFPVRVVIRF